MAKRSFNKIYKEVVLVESAVPLKPNNNQEVALIHYEII